LHEYLNLQSVILPAPIASGGRTVWNSRRI
jgi:hypothetical protein